MDEITAPELDTVSLTAPSNFNVCIRGFDTEDHAREFGELVGACVRELSRAFDLSQLDGVTIAYDYAQALLDLDRGYATIHRLIPSDTHVVGIAMTPSVMRGGSVKSHVVLNAAFMLPLEDIKHEHFGLALHTIAHECAHVEITHKFDAAFPGVLLQHSHPDARAAYRWQIILACWDEYAATRLSAGYGTKPTEGYEYTFLQRLRETRPHANSLIKAFRTHGSIDQILAEVYGAYGDLMKFAAYHLGNITGQGLSLSDFPKTTDAFAGHWFAPYFIRLDDACKGIAKDYGSWKDKNVFEVIGDLADEILAEGGLHFKARADGRLYIDIPYSAETMPEEP